MPVKPDSRFAHLPALQVTAPDGTPRQVIALRLARPPVSVTLTPHRVIQGESIDLLARRFYGDEKLWWRILAANPVVYPLDIQAGDLLSLPAPAPATRTTRARRF
jgi:nucleoid-associated protein YgaU